MGFDSRNGALPGFNPPASTPLDEDKVGRQGHGPTGEANRRKRATLPMGMWVMNPTRGLRAIVEPVTTRGPAEAFRKGAGRGGRTGNAGTIPGNRDGSLDSSSV